MRVLVHIPHPKFKVTLFDWNEKYVVKIEAGPMEQTYKFGHEEVKNTEALKNLLDDVFYQEVYDRFTAMFISMQEMKKRNI